MDTRTQHGIRTNHCPALDYALRANCCRRIHLRLRVDNRRTMDANWPSSRLLRLPQLRETGKISIRICRYDTGTVCKSCLTHRLSHNDTGGPGMCQLRRIARIMEKADALSVGRLQRSNPLNHRISVVTLQASTQGIDDFTKPQTHFAVPVYLAAFRALITLSVMSCLGLT